MKNTSREPYIYKVTNLENHQYYIGSQCSGKTIGVNYFTSSKNKEFREDFKNYGEEKYEITIIEEFTDPKECVDAENYMIRDHMQLKDGLCLNRAYHCNNKKIFSTVGTHLSEKTKQKLSEAKKGTHHPTSEETRKKISESLQGHPSWNKGLKGHPAWNKGLKGMHHSGETRKKISESLQGRPAPNRIKISIEGVAFDSLTDAAKYYNVTKPTISYWIKTSKHNSFLSDLKGDLNRGYRFI